MSTNRGGELVFRHPISAYLETWQATACLEEGLDRARGKAIRQTSIVTNRLQTLSVRNSITISVVIELIIDEHDQVVRHS